MAQSTTAGGESLSLLTSPEPHLQPVAHPAAHWWGCVMNGGVQNEGVERDVTVHGGWGLGSVVASATWRRGETERPGLGQCRRSGGQRGTCICCGVCDWFWEATSGPRLASRLRMFLSDICSRTATGGILAMVAGRRVTSAFMSLNSSSSCLRTGGDDRE